MFPPASPTRSPTVGDWRGPSRGRTRCHKEDVIAGFGERALVTVLGGRRFPLSQSVAFPSGLGRRGSRRNRRSLPVRGIGGKDSPVGRRFKDSTGSKADGRRPAEWTPIPADPALEPARGTKTVRRGVRRRRWSEAARRRRRPTIRDRRRRPPPGPARRRGVCRDLGAPLCAPGWGGLHPGRAIAGLRCRRLIRTDGGGLSSTTTPYRPAEPSGDLKRPRDAWQPCDRRTSCGPQRLWARIYQTPHLSPSRGEQRWKRT